MSGDELKDEGVLAKTWVHVFEEDTPAGAVYRPEDSDIPLSRRPRERLVLQKGGKARIFAAGPDDRYVEQAARWTRQRDALIVRARDGGLELEVVERSPGELIVRTRGAGPPR